MPCVVHFSVIYEDENIYCASTNVELAAYNDRGKQ